MEWSHPDFERLARVLDALRHMRATTTNDEVQRIAVAMLGSGEEAMRRMLAAGENGTYVKTDKSYRNAHAARRVPPITSANIMDVSDPTEGA